MRADINFREFPSYQASMASPATDAAGRALTHSRPYLETQVHERLTYEDCIKEPAFNICECHKGGVLCMTHAASRAGSPFICTGGAENDIKVWDFVSPAQSVEEKFKQLRDGRDLNLQDLKDLFASGDQGLQLHLRNYCLEAHVRAKLTGHRGSVFCLAAGNGMLMSGSADQTIRLWDLDTLRCAGTLVGHRSVVSTLDYSHPHLYSAGHDGKIRKWNLDTKSCLASIDSTKRAAIHSITTLRSERLLVGLERRWDEIMNPIKVWSMDLSECLDELPSKEMQQLSADSNQSKKVLEDLDKKMMQLGVQSRKTNSPLRITELKLALESAAESKEKSEAQLFILKEKFLQLKGDIYPVDDVYCMHVETCELKNSSEKRDVLFVGGNSKSILAWDVQKMMCIEAMCDEPHEADYTRCLVTSHGFLYSGGGKYTHQEKMASSSVAGKLKLDAQHAEVMQSTRSTGDSQLSDHDKCGRVTVWCSSTLKPLGSMTFGSVVMSLAIVQEKLFVGDVGGNMSVFVRQSSLHEFRTQIALQVSQSTSANALIAETYLARRAKLQVALTFENFCQSAKSSLDGICKMLTESIQDPALITVLLIELGKLLSQGVHPVAFESEKTRESMIDYLFDVIGRYPKLGRLQVHAINVLSLSVRVAGLGYVLAHEQLHVVSAVMRHEMKHNTPLQHAACLLYLEMLSPLRLTLQATRGVAVNETLVAVNDPTIDGGKGGLLPRNRPVSQSVTPMTSPMASLKAATFPGHSSSLMRDQQYKPCAVASIIGAGGLEALLTSISSYASPGCEVDSKGQADTSLIETAVALLRFMAVVQPDLCRGVLEHTGTGALDLLESRLVDEKLKLEKNLLLRDNNQLHTIIVDLAIAQGAMGIKIRGRPLPRPVLAHLPGSDLLSGIFTRAEGVSMEDRRAGSMAWTAILKSANAQQ